MKQFRTAIFNQLRLIATLGLIIPLIVTLYKHWMNVRAALLLADWQKVVFGLVLLMIAQPLMVLISWVILRQLNQGNSYPRIFNIYFLSQAAKYLPGGIWAFPGRMVAYQSIGVDRAASFVCMVREVSVFFIGAALVALAGLFDGLLVTDWVRISIVASMAVCIVSILLMQRPAFWRILAGFRIFKGTDLGTDSVANTAKFTYSWLPPTLLISLIFWALTGIAFREMAAGVSARINTISWFQAASIFALAWCAGFIVVIAPAGIGIREVVLSALLVYYMPFTEAISVALIARLWWTVAEAIFIVFSIFKVSRKEKT